MTPLLRIISAPSLYSKLLNRLQGYYWCLVSISLAFIAKTLRLRRSVNSREGSDSRMPVGGDERRYWLLNMVNRHGYSVREVGLATGFPDALVRSMIDRYCESTEFARTPGNGGVLSIYPYPGGRHPRKGFQDGALSPQRETKVSIFSPWDPRSYVVVDVPEAIFSNLGLLYLAHTHIPTIWDKRGIRLDPLEWCRDGSNSLSIRRQLPGGIEFGTRVRADTMSVEFQQWLINRSSSSLTRLRVQNCVLLNRLSGFEVQSNRNKIFRAPYVACESAQRNRWIIVAWDPCYRVWANPLCPCIHSDSYFPDCKPGERTEIKGRVWFHIGENIENEFRRLDASGWRSSC
jgi:hypothetical protein